MSSASFCALQPPGMVGGPMVLGRNFAVMTGVNAGLGCAIKKARGGVDDVQGRCELLLTVKSAVIRALFE